MDEQARFETRAVLAPRRSRLARVALLVPVVALIAVAAAGLSGARTDGPTAIAGGPTAFGAAAASPAQSPSAEVPYPGSVVGLDVQPLDRLQPQALGRDDDVAIAGWYVATAVTDCPPSVAPFESSAAPGSSPDVDALAFCQRSGVLYAARPKPRLGIRSFAATVVVGVVLPGGLERIGADPTQVVVVGRFVDGGCPGPTACLVLLIDHLAWTPAA